MTRPLSTLAAARAAASGTRWLLAGSGVLCFALGIVGTVVPGLPTTVFLLAGSYCLVRSYPELERRLRAHPALRRHAALLDPSTPVSAAMRRSALLGMWVSILASGSLLAWTGASTWLLGLLAAAGVAGTIAIARFRRHLER